MWIKLIDKNREYVINFNNITFFTKTRDCEHKPCIEVCMPQSGITLSYDSEEERDSIYENLRYNLEAPPVGMGDI